MRFLALLEETLNNPRLEIEKVSKGLWPSEGGIFYEEDGLTLREGGCNRKAWYRLMGTKKDGRGSNLKQLVERSFGHFVQNALTETAKLGRFYMGDEVPIAIERTTPKGSYTISGSIDIIVQDPMNGRPHLIECKSTGKAFFGQIYPTKEGHMAPNVSHAIQCLPYLGWARDVGGIEDPEMHVTYIDRANCTAGEHILKLDSNDALTIENDIGIQTWAHINLPALYKDFDTVYDHYLDGTPPDRPYVLVYDNSRIGWMLRNNRLTKTDKTKVERLLKADPQALDPDKTPVLTKGDYNCRFCEFAKTCLGSLIPDIAASPLFGEMDSSAEMGGEVAV